MNKRVLTLIDEANTTRTAQAAGLEKVDWRILVSYLVNREPNREPLETVLYVGMPPLVHDFAVERETREAYVHELKMGGFLVVTSEGGGSDASGGYSANIDVLMALDAMDKATGMHPDVVVLCSGDDEFACLATKLRRRGIRVEVAAAGESVGPHLRESANVVVDLTPQFRAVAEAPSQPRRKMAGFAMGNGRGGEPPRSE